MGEKLKYRVFLFLKIHSFQNPPQKHFGFDPCPNTDQRRARAPTQVSHPTSISQIFLLKYSWLSHGETAKMCWSFGRYFYSQYSHGQLNQLNLETWTRQAPKSGPSEDHKASLLHTTLLNHLGSKCLGFPNHLWQLPKGICVFIRGHQTPNPFQTPAQLPEQLGSRRLMVKAKHFLAWVEVRDQN